MMCGLYKEGGTLTAEMPVNPIEFLAPRWVYPMHGGSLPRGAIPDYTHARKDEAYVFEGKVFGRTIPG